MGLALVTKAMAAGSGNSAAGVLTQLSKASNSSSDEQDKEVDDTISIILSTSTGSSQRVTYGVEMVAVPQL